MGKPSIRAGAKQRSAAAALFKIQRIGPKSAKRFSGKSDA
jgi:hypothetical protein